MKPLSSHNRSNNLSSPLCMCITMHHLLSYHHCSSISSFISVLPCLSCIMLLYVCYLYRIHVIFWCTLIRSTLPTLTWGMELMLTALVWPSSIWTHAIQKDFLSKLLWLSFFFYFERFTIPQSWWLPSGKERIVEMYEIHQYIEHHHMIGFCLVCSW